MMLTNYKMRGFIFYNRLIAAYKTIVVYGGLNYG